ncbi:CLI_3235 family bacteriocin precursor [Ruminiclostridium josui]|uniref:CLI_3235 family bacteriocin precursor n=1 Tax=Ruminiclostridium josui TaxID=1499 RepID=UPI0004AE6D30|nr:CLI_3235 family bacteriocin precursor [Ruminiclostridium josui]
MKKLGKKLVDKKETLQAFFVDCDFECNKYCWSDPTTGIPNYAPRQSLNAYRDP